MVLLTMTASTVEALERLRDSRETKPPEDGTQPAETTETSEPSLEEPSVGKPISHGQIIDTWRQSHEKGHRHVKLEELLRGAVIYTPPPPPKPEPTAEFKALMARLRREEEERSYERLVQREPRSETFAERYPFAPMAHSFAQVNRPSKAEDVGEDDLDFGDVQKQVTLIINFLVSVVGCGAALWKAAQWWPVTTRLFVSLGGALVVAIAEVAVYSAYTWRMGEGEKKDRKAVEMKEIVSTWVVGEDDKTKMSDEDQAVPLQENPSDPNTPQLRRRTKELT
ncbi:endoplasmic reticulum-based factor for assembly of V-ATPase-domain-containing protein [Xylariaceae sp. FL0804]|nr:endoplasmic reticulum-based factor for assembly of V-ATPase-domain-containing protein [Xylariaceae sp. FL0804]